MTRTKRTIVIGASSVDGWLGHPWSGAAAGAFFGGMWGHSSDSFDERLKMWGVTGHDASRPTSDKGGGETTSAVYMDGEKVGMQVQKQMVDGASRSMQGPAWFDPTMISTPMDVSTARP
jgi:hypothetical protein